MKFLAIAVQKLESEQPDRQTDRHTHTHTHTHTDSSKIITCYADGNEICS